MVGNIFTEARPKPRKMRLETELADRQQKGSKV